MEYDRWWAKSSWIILIVHGVIPHDIHRGEEIQEHVISRKNHAYYLMGWGRSNSVHWTLAAVAKCEEVWIFAFVHWLLPARNMPEVLLSHENSRPHKCAHHWGIHKICANRVAAPTLHCRSHTVRFSSVCTCERHPVKKLFCEWQGTEEYHMPVVAEEREQLLLGGSTCCCSKMEEDCCQRGGLQWKVTTL